MLFKKLSELEHGYDKYAELKKDEWDKKVYDEKDRNKAILLSVLAGIFIILSLITLFHYGITHNEYGDSDYAEQTTTPASEYDDILFEHGIDVEPEPPDVFDMNSKPSAPCIESRGRAALSENKGNN